MQKYYTIKETARLLKISERTVWRWRNKYKIKAIKLGGIVRFSGDEIKKLIQTGLDKS